MAKRPTAKEDRHLRAVRQKPCTVCGVRPVEAHHVVGYADKMGRAPKRHDRVVPLCALHHRDSREAVHAIGHQRFCADHGIDLMLVALQLWEKSGG